MSGLIHALTMADGFLDAQDAKRKNTRDECPECDGLKSKTARVCIHCRPARQVKRSAEARENHRRYNAALEAGWTAAEMLIAGHPPTPEEINERAPEVAIKHWPEVVIRGWCRGMGH